LVTLVSYKKSKELNMYRFILILALITPHVFANDCPIEDRLTKYNTLKVKLENMLDLIPAMNPSDKTFYKEVMDNIYSKPSKYKGFLSDEGYIVYSNTKVLENHLFWVDLAVEALQTSNEKIELMAFSRLMIGSVKDIDWLSGISDSKFMYENKIVSKEYAEIGASLTIGYGTIALCMANHYEAIISIQ
jgi:hypothetical protein